MKKRYDVVKDVEYLLFSDLRGQKQKQVRQRIIDAVLATPPPQFLDRLWATVFLCYIAWYTELPSRSIAQSIIRELIDRLWRKKQLAFFVDISALNYRLPAAARDVAIPSTLRPILTREKMLHDTHRLFVSEFFLYVSATLERSVEFALFLMEQVSMATQQFIDWRSQHSGIPMPTHLQFPNSRAVVASTIIFQSAISPPDATTPQKRWIERLIDSAQNDPMADDVLEGLFETLRTLNGERRELRCKSMEEGSVRTQEFAKAIGSSVSRETFMDLMQNPVLILAPHHLRMITDRYERRSRLRDARYSESSSTMARFMEKRGVLSALFDARCTAILERASRGLRPAGHDHIEVTVTPLRGFGIRAISFYPEGHVFPNVGVHLMVRDALPRLLVIPATLENFELKIPLGVFESPNADAPLLDVILEFVIVDVLYRIVVGDTELRLKHAGVGIPNRSKSTTGRVIPVRPFFRRLPEGWQMSGGARERALSTLGWLKPGCTFVKEGKRFPAQYRNGRIVYDLPTEPFAIYGDEDLLEGIKEDP